MYFLPSEEVTISWVSNDNGPPLEGHCWYDGEYCYFRPDSLDCDLPCDPNSKFETIYCLFSMNGELLVRELARRKVSELDIDGECPAEACLKRLMRGDARKNSNGLRFIGRFLDTRPI